MTLFIAAYTSTGGNTSEPHQCVLGMHCSEVAIMSDDYSYVW